MVNAASLVLNHPAQHIASVAPVHILRQTAHLGRELGS